MNLRRYAVEWSIAFALWLIFVFSVEPSELLAGSIAAGFSVLGLEIILKAVPLGVEVQKSDLAAALQVPKLVVQGLWALCRVFARRITGKRSESVFLATQFNARGSETCQAGRRALVVSFLTTPPNSVVVGIDSDTKQMLIHQVKKSPLPSLVGKLEGSE